MQELDNWKTQRSKHWKTVLICANKIEILIHMSYGRECWRLQEASSFDDGYVCSVFRSCDMATVWQRADQRGSLLSSLSLRWKMRHLWSSKYRSRGLARVGNRGLATHRPRPAIKHRRPSRAYRLRRYVELYSLLFEKSNKIHKNYRKPHQRQIIQCFHCSMLLKKMHNFSLK